jgi:imidazole glycerol-phosphate synthase subunit HisH
MSSIQKIGVLDLGLGNLANILKVIEYFKLKAILVKKESDFELLDKLILPGVGSFNHFYENVKKNNLEEKILNYIERKKILLGICLGMQVLTNKSFENGEHEGLKVVNREVLPLKSLDKKIITPNFGWYKIKKKNKTNSFFDDFVNQDFYFAHSFYCSPSSYKSDIYMELNGNNISAGFEQENIIATQFHPELSSVNGLQFYKKFFQL